jgi:hypothetical protein
MKNKEYKHHLFTKSGKKILSLRLLLRALYYAEYVESEESNKQRVHLKDHLKHLPKSKIVEAIEKELMVSDSVHYTLFLMFMKSCGDDYA